MSFPCRSLKIQHRPFDLSLGLVAPLPKIRTQANIKNFLLTIDKALDGGASYVQLWGPNKELEKSFKTILDLKQLVEKKRAFLIINNCVDIAYKAKLDGAHIGQNDLSWSATRQKLGSSALIGLTVNIWSDVLAAQQSDVNYLGVQIHPSKITKPLKQHDTLPWGLEGAKKIHSFSRHRVVLIGNITFANLPTLKEILRPGDGVAISGEIMRAENPYQTTKKIHDLIKGWGL